MKLANYISDLLYRYDCVIVPNFGGFITNKISATLNNTTHTFYPPTKQIGFNSNLKHNDGLLANYIASAENISFEKANNFIDKAVFTWLNDLGLDSIEIETIGKMSLNTEKQLIFEPNIATNFLTDSFGLSSLTSPVQERFKEQVMPLYSVEETGEDPSEPNEEGTEKKSAVGKKGISVIAKTAAAAAILLTLGFGYQQYNTIQEKNHFAEQQENIEKKIQTATFVIDNPLPTINLNVNKVTTKEFHVIAGAFELTKNANKKVNQLQKQGYKNACVLGKNKWGLIQVAFDSFETKSEARIALKRVKRVGFNDAWLLVKKNN